MITFRRGRILSMIRRSTIEQVAMAYTGEWFVWLASEGGSQTPWLSMEYVMHCLELVEQDSLGELTDG